MSQDVWYEVYEGCARTVFNSKRKAENAINEILSKGHPAELLERKLNGKELTTNCLFSQGYNKPDRYLNGVVRKLD